MWSILICIFDNQRREHIKYTRWLEITMCVSVYYIVCLLDIILKRCGFWSFSPMMKTIGSDNDGDSIQYSPQSSAHVIVLTLDITASLPWSSSFFLLLRSTLFLVQSSVSQDYALPQEEKAKSTFFSLFNDQTKITAMISLFPDPSTWLTLVVRWWIRVRCYFCLLVTDGQPMLMQKWLSSSWTVLKIMSAKWVETKILFTGLLASSRDYLVTCSQIIK